MILQINEKFVTWTNMFGKIFTGEITELDGDTIYVNTDKKTNIPLDISCNDSFDLALKSAHMTYDDLNKLVYA